MGCSLPVQGREPTHVTGYITQPLQAQQHPLPAHRLTFAGIDPVAQRGQPAAEHVFAHQLPGIAVSGQPTTGRGHALRQQACQLV